MKIDPFVEAIQEWGTWKEIPEENLVKLYSPDGELLKTYEKTLNPDDIRRKEKVTHIMNKAPRSLIRGLLRWSAFKEGSNVAKGFLERPGSYDLFESVYNYLEEGDKGKIDKILNETNAAFSVRNRFIRMSDIFEKGFSLLPEGESMIAIGYGSGHAKIEQEAMRKAVDQDNDVYFIGFDMDHQAVDDARAIAKSLGLEDRVRLIKFQHGLKEEPPNLTYDIRGAARNMGVIDAPVRLAVNMGINEYMDIGTTENTQIQNLQTSMYNTLKHGGFLVATQTAPHDRIPFLERVLDWNCRYRDLGEMREIVQASGFDVVLANKDPTGGTNYVVGKK